MFGLSKATIAALLLVTAFVLYSVGAIPYKVYVIHTGSMDPSIPSRSAVIVREHEYRIGQVVTFTINGTTVTHRLLAINADGTITTKGDANRSADPWHAPERNIIGGVVAAPRYLGWVLIFLFRTTGGLGMLLLLMFFWWSFDLARSLDELRRIKPAAEPVNASQ